MDKTDSLPSEQALLRELYTMEVDRVKYILRAYLRARLHKVRYRSRTYDNSTFFQLEGLVSYQLSTPELQQKLSKHELDYAHRCEWLLIPPMPHTILHRYKQAFDSHMLKAFLASLPQQQRKLDEEVMMPRPNLDTFVFARVRVTIGAFQVEEGCVALAFIWVS